jgi:hypothetical protein
MYIHTYAQRRFGKGGVGQAPDQACVAFRAYLPLPSVRPHIFHGDRPVVRLATAGRNWMSSANYYYVHSKGTRLILSECICIQHISKTRLLFLFTYLPSSSLRKLTFAPSYPLD